MTQPASDNAPRVDAHAGGHVESWFIKANDPSTGRALWVKHTVLVPEDASEGATADVWAIAFRRGDPTYPRAAKVSRPLESASLSGSPFKLEHDAGVFEGRRIRGQVHTSGTNLSWSLELGEGPSHKPYAHEAMYTGPFPRSKTLTPRVDCKVFGTFEVDGTRWEVRGWPGMQGHNWGPAHAPEYAWAHVNAFDDAPGAWFEAVTGRVDVGPMRTPWLSAIALHADGRTYRFDDVKGMVGTTVVVGPNRLRFRAERGDVRLWGVLLAKKEEMAGLYYPNPDGRMTHCLNSKIASTRLRLERPSSPALILRSRAAALEIGTLKRDHGVAMRV